MTTDLMTDVPPVNTPEWLEWRRGGLGASDLPTVLGMDPFRTEHELWLTKTGQVAAFTGNAKTRWGHRLEHIGVDVWREEHPGWVVAGNSMPYHDPRWPHLWATPDAIGMSSTSARNVGIEVKVTAAWSEPPDRTRVQSLAQAGIADLERVDVVRLSFDDDPAIFPIARDEAAIADICDAGEAWYVLHVLGGVEPPQRGDMVEADERQEQLAADLRSVLKAKTAMERREHAIRADLVASVAGRGVITGAGFRIEVRAAHDMTRTGWKEVATDHRSRLLEMGVEPSELDGIESQFRTTSRMRPAVYPTWTEEETE